MTPRRLNIPLPNGCVCGDNSCQISFGYCHCACGTKTTITRWTNQPQGDFAGWPRVYLKGHKNRIRLSIENCPTFKIEGVYCRLIKLTQGYYTIVWDSDYVWLMQWKWRAYICRSGNPYAVRTVIDGTKRYSMFMHSMLHQPSQGKVTDHESGISLDNRRTNLRDASRSQNNQNSDTRKDNTSGRKGVHKLKGRNKYTVGISVDKKHIHVGNYDTFELACEARREAEIKYHGEYSRT